MVDVRRLPGVLVAEEFEGPGRPWDSTWYRRPVLSRWCTRSSKKNSTGPLVRTYHSSSRFFFSAALHLSPLFSATLQFRFFISFSPRCSRNRVILFSLRYSVSSSSSLQNGRLTFRTLSPPCNGFTLHRDFFFFFFFFVIFQTINNFLESDIYLASISGLFIAMFS